MSQIEIIRYGNDNISDDYDPIMGCVNTSIYRITLKIQLLNSKILWVRKCLINHKTHIQHTLRNNKVIIKCKIKIIAEIYHGSKH